MRRSARSAPPRSCRLVVVGRRRPSRSPRGGRRSRRCLCRRRCRPWPSQLLGSCCPATSAPLAAMPLRVVCVVPAVLRLFRLVLRRSRRPLRRRPRPRRCRSCRLRCRLLACVPALPPPPHRHARCALVVGALACRAATPSTARSRFRARARLEWSLLRPASSPLTRQRTPDRTLRPRQPLRFPPPGACRLWRRSRRCRLACCLQCRGRWFPLFRRPCARSWVVSRPPTRLRGFAWRSLPVVCSWFRLAVVALLCLCSAVDSLFGARAVWLSYGRKFLPFRCLHRGHHPRHCQALCYRSPATPPTLSPLPARRSRCVVAWAGPTRVPFLVPWPLSLLPPSRPQRPTPCAPWLPSTPRRLRSFLRRLLLLRGRSQPRSPTGRCARLCTRSRGFRRVVSRSSGRASCSRVRSSLVRVSWPLSVVRWISSSRVACRLLFARSSSAHA